MDNAEFRAQSLDEPERFWSQQAERIEWHDQPQTVLDAANPPLARWFVGGTTNLCHNAVDRHLAQRADQPALIFVSTETRTEKTFTYRELHAEVQRVAACLLSLGVTRGDRVLLYMPMIPEAVFAMLACARIGAIHCVVFGGFASAALAGRIEDAQPRVIVSADAGMRGGKLIPYKPLLDDAIRLSAHKPDAVLLTDRGLVQMALEQPRDVLMSDWLASSDAVAVPCVWLESSEASYILYTSGTTGKPKGVQRDVGGYAVALATSMDNIFGARGGETFFCTSDVGWVVGHSYIVYGPLLAGMATILYEGLPTQGLDGGVDGAIWWRLVEKYRVSVMFSAPTAVRVLKSQDPTLLAQHDVSSLRALFLAGEPLDEPTARWISDGLKVPIIDNYWQTETGWPMITVPQGFGSRGGVSGSPGLPVYGWRVKLLDEATGAEVLEPGRKGVVALEWPTPPGFMQTLWRDDARFASTYWSTVPGAMVYSTFDWGVRDENGYFFILGRTDDVINVAGHRLGTREIEECIAGHPAVAEVAVVGVSDVLKGQVPVAFVVCKGSEAAGGVKELLAQLSQRVTHTLGAIARPSRLLLVPALPKTRSGKVMRRAIQAVCEQRDPGDLSTMEDSALLEHARAAFSEP
ncbi:MAG TPA: propionate--CoA ligase [Ramlibacter sp.]|nr:propionate--CoA ligase [Ramlibacter sp.]